jgi:FKBP-type peptidyl-prolyl cis-trans isomerase 2
MAEAKHGDKVKVHYTGKLTDGRVFDSSVEREPMAVTIGSEQTLADLEKALIGMSPGESKTIKIGADRAFGPHRDELVANISSDQIAPGLEPKVGQRLEASQGDSQKAVVTVTDVNESGITVDANHPLAEKT